MKYEYRTDTEKVGQTNPAAVSANSQGLQRLFPAFMARITPLNVTFYLIPARTIRHFLTCKIELSLRPVAIVHSLSISGS